VGQIIHTELDGINIGEVTSGDIRVTAISSTRHTISSLPGHPEYPGTVTFSITGTDANPSLSVSAEYKQGDFGLPPDAYDFFTGLYWSSYADRVDQVVEGLDVAG
jgi:hypothetical protein